jgi:hypothetical protein
MPHGYNEVKVVVDFKGRSGVCFFKAVGLKFAVMDSLAHIFI